MTRGEAEPQGLPVRMTQRFRLKTQSSGNNFLVAFTKSKQSSRIGTMSHLRPTPSRASPSAPTVSLLANTAAVLAVISVLGVLYLPLILQ